MEFGKDIEKTCGSSLPARGAQMPAGSTCVGIRDTMVLGPWPMEGAAEGLQGQKPSPNIPLVLQPGSQGPYSKPVSTLVTERAAMGRTTR